MKKLFLEGDRFVGKSTLLRKCLKSLSISVEGFYVERRLNEAGRIIGFELRDAKELKNETIAPPNDNHCFIWNENGKRSKRLEVFEQFGLSILERALQSSADIILLDEIGGIELLSDSFSKRLFLVLHQSRKIVGVYKSEKNYQYQRQNTLGELTIHQQRKKLKKIILQNEGEIIKLTQENTCEMNQLFCEYLI